MNKKFALIGLLMLICQQGKSQGLKDTRTSTANEQVSVFDENMYIPQLDRYRKIWLYLPQSYESSNKSYPVLYMLDGQNVFDDSTSYAGEWKVDETLTKLENKGFETAIVVAIDNGGEHRFNEYSPYIHEEYGGGEGEDFLEFIVQSLKPKIDQSFRTLGDQENTGIMGSSMGGLFSHYAHLKYPEIFGRLGIFSPSFWISDDCYTNTIEQGKPESNCRLYLLSGLQEYDTCRLADRMDSTLISIGYSNQQVKRICSPDGEHSEWFWAREFEEAYLWLFRKDSE